MIKKKKCAVQRTQQFNTLQWGTVLWINPYSVDAV